MNSWFEIIIIYTIIIILKLDISTSDLVIGLSISKRTMDFIFIIERHKYVSYKRSLHWTF